MKTEVRYEPRKEVIIHEYTLYNSAEDLINTSVSALPPGSFLTALRWVNGVLLSFKVFPINEITTKELLEGRLHSDHVSFAPMPEYRKQITHEKGVTIIITDVSKNPIFVAIAEFLKNQFLET